LGTVEPAGAAAVPAAAGRNAAGNPFAPNFFFPSLEGLGSEVAVLLLEPQVA